MWTLIQHIVGVDDLTGAWYGFWSGFGADLSMFVAVAVWYRKNACHTRGCWRIAHHEVDGKPYKVCRKHDPNHDGSKPPTAGDVANG